MQEATRAIGPISAVATHAANCEQSNPRSTFRRRSSDCKKRSLIASADQVFCASGQRPRSPERPEAVRSGRQTASSFAGDKILQCSGQTCLAALMTSKPSAANICSPPLVSNAAPNTKIVVGLKAVTGHFRSGILGSGLTDCCQRASCVRWQPRASPSASASRQGQLMAVKMRKLPVRALLRNKTSPLHPRTTDSIQISR